MTHKALFTMNEKFKYLVGKSGSFKRNVMIMSSGAFINMFIALALYPVVTRLYSKEEFGGFGLFAAVVGLISLGGTALYPTGLVIPKYKREFLAMLKLSLCLMIITVAVSMIIIIFFNELVIMIFKLEYLGDLIYFIPLGILLNSIHTIFFNWNIRKKEFGKNASSSVVSGLSAKIFSIGYAVGFSASTFGFILSRLVSIFLSIVTLGAVKMVNELRLLRVINIKEVMAVAKKYHKYPKHLLPANIVNKYTSDLPIYMLTGYFSPAVAGAFFLANSVLSIPLSILGNSSGSVFLQKANELYISKPSEMAEFTYTVHKNMLYIGTFIFGFVYGFGDVLFAFVFGVEWQIAGQIAGIISTYYIFMLISGPLAKVYRIVGKEQYSLYISVLLAILRSLGMWVGIQSNDPILAVLYFSMGNLIGYFFNSVLIFRAVNFPGLKPIIESFAIIIIGFSIFYGLRLGFDHIFDLSTWLVIGNVE